MEKKTTIHDIAKALGTTAATVSRALNDNPRISEKKKKEVKAMAKKMGYERNHIASALRMGKSNTVGVIVPFVDREFFSSILGGMEEVLRSQGYNLLICQSKDNHEDEKQSIDTLLKAQVSGIFISVTPQTTLDSVHLKKIKADTQLIMFDRVLGEIDCSAVVIDDFKGGYEATQHLLKSGYPDVLCFSGDLRLDIYKERLRGYKQALEDNGIPFSENKIRQIPITADAGREEIEQVLKEFQPPFGLFCASDFTAFGALRRLTKKGISVPDEVGIVGFSNNPFTEYVTPPLSTVSQKSREIGKMVAQTFLEQQNQQGNEMLISKKISLQPELLVRGSSNRSN